MKKTIIALMLILLAGSIPCAAQYTRGISRHHSYGSHRNYADLVEVTVREPGTLEDRMPKEMFQRVRMLRVEGPLDDKDLKFIAKLAKRSKVVDDRDKSIDNYLDVDLERATVMERDGRRINHDVLPRRAFEYGSRLRSIVLPERLKAVGRSAFANCSDLEEVVMPPRVYELGDYAFDGCANLRYFTVPTSLETIGSNCFDGCTSLSQFNLPSSVRFIGKEAFENCPIVDLRIPSYCDVEDANLGFLPKLRNIDVDRGNNQFSSYDGVLYDRDGVTLLMFPAGRTGSCRLPDKVEVIAPKAFYKSNVTAIELPETVVELGESAFESSSHLRSIFLPDGINVLPKNLFNGCSDLSDVSMGEISSMGDYAFKGCSSLKSFTIVGPLSSIPAGAFEDCKGLRQIELPESVTSIGEKAFHECNTLVDISFGDGVTTIGKQAFDRCYALQSIDLPNVRSIEEKVFYECKALRSVALGNNVRSIGKEAFRRCKELASITLPESVTTIDKEAFRECTNLAEINLNEGLLLIGDNALRETAIIHLVLPSSINKLGKKVAEKCKSLLRIECRAAMPPEIESVSNDKLSLYVPSASVEAYKNAKNWKKFKSVNPL